MSLEVGSPVLRLLQQPSSLVICGPEATSLGLGHLLSWFGAIFYVVLT